VRIFHLKLHSRVGFALPDVTSISTIHGDQSNIYTPACECFPNFICFCKFAFVCCPDTRFHRTAKTNVKIKNNIIRLFVPDKVYHLHPCRRSQVALSGNSSARVCNVSFNFAAINLNPYMFDYSQSLINFCKLYLIISHLTQNSRNAGVFLFLTRFPPSRE